MKTFLELVKTRRSVRKYEERAVEPEKLEYVLECARLAPSAVNFQPWRFIVVGSSELRKTLNECYDRSWFAAAPAVIAVCADENVSWKRTCDGHDHADVDASIAAEHICLAAAEQGLGTCWVCNFDVEKCRKVLNLEPNMRPVALLPIGYPSASASQEERPRKPLSEVVVKL